MNGEWGVPGGEWTDCENIASTVALSISRRRTSCLNQFVVLSNICPLGSLLLCSSASFTPSRTTNPENLQLSIFPLILTSSFTFLLLSISSLSLPFFVLSPIHFSFSFVSSSHLRLRSSVIDCHFSSFRHSSRPFFNLFSSLNHFLILCSPPVPLSTHATNSNTKHKAHNQRPCHPLYSSISSVPPCTTNTTTLTLKANTTNRHSLLRNQKAVSPSSSSAAGSAACPSLICLSAQASVI